MLTNVGQPSEFYAVYFNADGSLNWSQMAGDYPGKWTLQENKLTLDFPLLSVQIKADLTSDDKFSNISSTNSSTINSGQLMNNTPPLLDQTSWKGSRNLNDAGTAIQPLQMEFTPGSQVSIRFTQGNTTTTTKYGYTATKSGAIRAASSFSTDVYFGVFTSAHEMKGSWHKYKFTWQTTKQ